MYSPVPWPAAPAREGAAWGPARRGAPGAHGLIRRDHLRVVGDP